MKNSAEGAGPFAALRRFARARPTRERCELCGADLPGEHPHLLGPAQRSLVCTCSACALLFASGKGRFRCVPRRVEHLLGFRMTDARWESLHVPIDLAFFFPSTPARAVIALYPSPAGVTECAAGDTAWQELAEENPVLRELEPDVEALLVNRLPLAQTSVESAGEYFRVPIDDCFRLAGMLRKHWRGLAGGTEVWKEMATFFNALRRKAEPRHV